MLLSILFSMYTYLWYWYPSIIFNIVSLPTYDVQYCIPTYDIGPQYIQYCKSTYLWCSILYTYLWYWSPVYSILHTYLWYCIPTYDIGTPVYSILYTYLWYCIPNIIFNIVYLPMILVPDFSARLRTPSCPNTGVYFFFFLNIPPPSPPPPNMGEKFCGWVFFH